MKAIHIVIHGRVQGVFFRKYTQDKARELNLKGQVKNLSDGSVEVFAQGDNDRLKEFVEWCYKGSPESKVESVETNMIAAGSFTSFEIVS